MKRFILVHQYKGVEVIEGKDTETRKTVQIEVNRKAPLLIYVDSILEAVEEIDAGSASINDFYCKLTYRNHKLEDVVVHLVETVEEVHQKIMEVNSTVRNA